MPRNFREIEATLSPERVAAIRDAAARDIQTMLLAELRKHAGRTAADVAADLGVDGATLARLESGDDMPVSTLRRLVAALGGELDFIVRLPERTVGLQLFGSSWTGDTR